MQNEALKWLKNHVFPLWCKVGIGPNHLFVEGLTFDAIPLLSPPRALVQARQIYSFCEGLRLDVISNDIAQPIVTNATHAFIKHYGQSDGSFRHSEVNRDTDLYTQAFALFGLAHAFEITQEEQFKQRAYDLMDYLLQQRRNNFGGFTEIKNDVVLFQSNPHMHLLEAGLAWLKVDKNPLWQNLAQELKDLCLEEFIEPTSGILAEHFNEKWIPLRNDEGHFIFEPGHQYEWSWLLHQYDTNLFSSSLQLFENGEKYGLSSDKSLALDEVWSNGEVKKASSRFWPQCERIKAAVILKRKDIAEISMKALKENFLIEQGLWRDTRLDENKYGSQPVKASSLYHIINAISEYVKLRDTFENTRTS